MKSTEKSKPLDDISLEDMLENPIWTYALDEEAIDGHDETWLKPILNAQNVEKRFLDVYILLRKEDDKKYVSANLNIEKMKLFDIAFWEYNQWQPLELMDDIRFPLYITSIPRVLGDDNVQFVIEDKYKNNRIMP